MRQTFTYIDVGGNRARYSVSDKDRHAEFSGSTDHGYHGVAQSFAEAQGRVRTALKDSMAVNRRSDEATTTGKYSVRWRSR